jgi:hypothetical protein
MSIEAEEVRCSACGSLLARLEQGALVIHRGDMHARVAGDVSVELTCYRRTCRRPTVVRIFSTGVVSQSRVRGALESK